MEQCAESTRITDLFEGRRMKLDSFGLVLIQHVPANVRTKLEGWGVLDFASLFRRSLGLHAVFQEFPSADALSPDFLRRYHRYLDQWYEQRVKDAGCDTPTANEFTFELYASGEYTLLLEESWGTGSEPS
jgi:hypothetical protein